jgi:hypothetical protein
MRRRKRQRDMNDKREKTIDQLTMAIACSIASSGHASKGLYRYRTVLERLIAWEKKLRMAERKMAYYGAKEKYYDKVLRKHD